jgi:hypothetical protein
MRFPLAGKVFGAAATILAAFLTSTCSPAVGADWKNLSKPNYSIDDVAGLNIHFVVGHQKDIEDIHTAGFHYIRFDLFWADTEKVRGSYRWTDYDQLMLRLSQFNLRPYFILDYSNPLYVQLAMAKSSRPGSKPQPVSLFPSTKAAVDAYVHWATTAAKRYAKYNPIIEIWNEPDYPIGKIGGPTPAQYVALASQACQSIRAALPDAKIVGPAAAIWPGAHGSDPVFWQSFLQSDLPRCLNYISLHPYRKTAPDTLAADIASLEAKYPVLKNPAGQPRKVIAGEWGYTLSDPGITTRVQGAYLVRQKVIAASQRVPVNIWYAWRDFSGGLADAQANYGITTVTGDEKVSYVAALTSHLQIGAYTLVQSYSDGDISAFLGVKDSMCRLVVWTTGYARTVNLPIPTSRCSANAKLSAFDMLGGPVPATSVNASIQLPVSGEPTYVTLN